MGQRLDRLGRDLASTADGCERAMLLSDHHDWVNYAAKQLQVGGAALWHACARNMAALLLKLRSPRFNAIEDFVS